MTRRVLRALVPWIAAALFYAYLIFMPALVGATPS